MNMKRMIQYTIKDGTKRISSCNNIAGKIMQTGTITLKDRIN